MKKLPDQYQYLAEFRPELSVAVRNCIKHHYALMEAAKMLEDFVNSYVFIKSLQVTFQTCNLAFTLTKVS